MNNATSRPEAPSSGAAAGGDPVGSARRSGIAGLISEPNFRRLWIAGSFSGTIRWLETLAVAVFVFDKTGDAFIVALMMFFRMLPMFLFGAVAGVVADRIDRKTMLVGGFLILAANSIIMGVLALTDVLEIWHLAIGIFISGIVWSSEFPVRRTMMGEVAGMDRVGLAMGLDSATVNATRMLGPTLGGVLLQYLDLEGVFFVGAGFYLAAFVTAIPVSYVQGASPTKGLSFVGNLRSGFGYIRSRRVVVGILAVTIMVNIFGFPYVAMVPVIGRDELGLSPVLIGVLASAEGLGALITALTIATHAGTLKYTRIYLYGSFLFLVSVLLFSLSDWFALSLPIIFIGGVGIAGFGTMQSTLVMMATPPEMRSRVMGALSVSIGTGPLGILHVGLLALLWGAPMAVMVIAIEGLIVLSIAALIWPELRRRTDVRPPDLREVMAERG
ncbi:MAG: MFS transporter [Chloroflexi bacterium]|nr:MFS transporter [Chloroflexota bacterium]